MCVFSCSPASSNWQKRGEINIEQNRKEDTTSKICYVSCFDDEVWLKSSETQRGNNEEAEEYCQLFILSYFFILLLPVFVWPCYCLLCALS